MTIDETVYAAIDDGAWTTEQVFDLIMQMALRHAEATCLAEGFAAADVALVLERLRKNPPSPFETVRAMLESRATSVQ